MITNKQKSFKKPLIIAITGGSASGKTFITKQLCNKLNLKNKKTLHISQDNFYKKYSEHERELIKNNKFNFDRPSLINFNEIKKVLDKLINYQNCKIPIYSYKDTNIIGFTEINEKYDIIIIEGIFILYEESLLKYFDIKIFVDTSPEIRFQRRLQRDITSRMKLSLQEHMNLYTKYVCNSFNKYILPLKYKVDLIVNGNENCDIFIELMLNYILNFYF